VDWLEELLTGYDLVVSATVAVDHVLNGDGGETLGPTTVVGEAVDPAIGWCLTPATNFTGHPSASVPVGLTAAGHPVGMQIIGRRFADADVVAASAAVERLLPWHASLIPSSQGHER
jgi:amidase/aspartyl-tRNA(Asn)/glutamyl-tRNA(Gln) amidotransferase subunit A